MNKSFIAFWFSIILSIFFILMFFLRGWPFFFFLFLPPIFWGFSKKDETYKETFYDGERESVYNFCPNCGHQLEGYERFCPICGYRLKE